ncbi:ATP-binding protein [Comamonadaceae bacterium PP-2]
MLEITNDRAVSKATIITGQLLIEHWHPWGGGATIADAILDCLIYKLIAQLKTHDHRSC